MQRMRSEKYDAHTINSSDLVYYTTEVKSRSQILCYHRLTRARRWRDDACNGFEKKKAEDKSKGTARWGRLREKAASWKQV